MKKFLSLVLALVMTMSLVTVSAGAKDFTDAEDITYVEAVEVMTEIGVVDGDTAGNFNPANGLTRGAAAKIICNLILGPTTAAALNADTNPYPDVDKDSVFAGYIAYCQKEGIISGYADGTFKPANPLTGYAFMKMLLGALGYDPTVEGYTGANWSINVAKRAINIGLDDGLVEDFNGSDYVTREEAMLYALNTLTADMVEYDSRTEVSVGGADVVISGSDAKVVENNSKTDGKIDRDGDMQFAEKYFSKLELEADEVDAFARPANKWYWKGELVGTYSATADVAYTADVELGKIYKDLNLSEKTNATLWVNGIQQDTIGPNSDGLIPVSKGNIDALGDDFVGAIGNGTQVEVFYDDNADEIKICAISTYVGEITSVKAATAAVDAYVVVDGFDSYNDTVLNPLNTGRFEVENAEELFEEEDIVLYTYSNSENEIMSIQLVEGTEATLNTIWNGQKVSLNGEVIKYGREVSFDDQNNDNNLTTKSNYDYYLDNYGYVIYMAESKFLSSEFAFVESTRTGGNTWQAEQVKLVYTDGTAGVVNTDVDYSDDELGDFYQYVVTFKQNAKGQTVLKKVDSAVVYDTIPVSITTGGAAVIIDNNGNGNYEVNVDKTYFADSDTILVVKNAANKYKAYTGAKNFPTITNVVDSIAVYAKGTSVVAKIIWVDCGASTAVTSGSADVTYFAGASMTKHTRDTDVADYYSFNVVRAGKIETIKVAVASIDTILDGGNANLSAGKSGAYKGLTFNPDGHLTAAVDCSTEFDQIRKLSGKYTFGFDADLTAGQNWQYVTVDEEATQVFFVDHLGEITKGSISDLSTSDYNGSYVLKADGVTAEYVFIDVPKDGVTNDTVVGGTSSVYTATMSVSGSALQVAVAGGAAGDTSAIEVYSLTVTNVTNNTTNKITSAALTSTNLSAGALSTEALTGVTFTATGMNRYDLVLKIGNELVSASYFG